MKSTILHTRNIGGRRVDYRVNVSSAAKKIRIRVGVNGIEVLQPRGRSDDEVVAFLDGNRAWLHNQMDRAATLRSLRRHYTTPAGHILIKGNPTEIVQAESSRRITNLVQLGDDGKLLIIRGRKSPTSTAASFENWLRRLARRAITAHINTVAQKLKVEPKKLYVRGQRTKWGNCSSKQNVSVNWRIVMAPDFVLRYLVSHELAHLIVPDHSKRFWLTVQSVCPDAQRARGWLSANAWQLMVEINDLLMV